MPTITFGPLDARRALGGVAPERSPWGEGERGITVNLLPGTGAGSTGGWEPPLPSRCLSSAQRKTPQKFPVKQHQPANPGTPKRTVNCEDQWQGSLWRHRLKARHHPTGTQYPSSRMGWAGFQLGGAGVDTALWLDPARPVVTAVRVLLRTAIFCGYARLRTAEVEGGARLRTLD